MGIASERGSTCHARYKTARVEQPRAHRARPTTHGQSRDPIAVNARGRRSICASIHPKMRPSCQTSAPLREIVEPSPFTPLLSLKAYFRPKWYSKTLISPGTNPLQHLFDTGPEKPGEVRQFWAFLQVTDPSFDTFLTQNKKRRLRRGAGLSSLPSRPEETK
jgi:hypothetical protein